MILYCSTYHCQARDPQDPTRSAHKGDKNSRKCMAALLLVQGAVAAMVPCRDDAGCLCDQRQAQGKAEDVQRLKCFNPKNSEKKTSKSFALDESSSQDGEISLDETDSSFTDASNAESEQSFVRSEVESNQESDCILTDPEDDNDDIVLD